MRRVTISRRQLFGTVGGICFLTAVYLTIWTLVDAPTKGRKLTLQIYDESDESYIANDPSRAWWQVPATPISVTYYCRSSGSSAWNTIGLVWQGLLLLSAAILAMNTRRIQKRWNESRSLAMMTYTQGALALMRLLLWVLEEPSEVSAELLDLCRSFLLSLDALLALLIYFGSKLATVYKLVDVADGAVRSRDNAFVPGRSECINASGVSDAMRRNLRGPEDCARYSLENATNVSQYLAAIGQPLPSHKEPHQFQSNLRLTMGPKSNAGDIIVSEASSRRLNVLGQSSTARQCPHCMKCYDDAVSAMNLVSKDDMDLPSARHFEMTRLTSDASEATN
jgi:7 transmembrane sweet-taste receptor of 3 GCPR